MLIARALSGQVSREGPTYFENAYRVMMLPVGVFAVSAAMAAYPTLAAFVARDDDAGYGRVLSETLRRVLFLTIPSTAILIAARHPVIDILFGRGAFTPLDVDATARALLYFAPGIIGLSAQQVLIRGFYALDDSRTPVAVGIGGVGMALGLALALRPHMGIEGLCLALSASAVSAFAVMWMLLARRRRAAKALAQAAPSLWKLATASVLAYGGAVLGLAIAGNIVPADRGTTSQLVRVGLPLAVGLLGLVAGVLLLRIEEGLALARAFRRKKAR
jgi:putative peptidoglycan lipid II flippase